MRLAHTQRLERWFGSQWVAEVSVAMQHFRYPVPILGQGNLVVYDGDFYGAPPGGMASSLWEYVVRPVRNERGGFATTQALRDSAPARIMFPYNKSAAISPPAVGACMHWWALGALPVAGSNAAAAPGGTVPDNTTTGAFQPLDNAPTGDTRHLTELWAWEDLNVRTGSVMVYDYLFGVNINHATTSNSVTGVPTRYQTSALAPGNFLSGRVTTGLGATAHNITVTYVDQDGNTAEAGTAQAIRVSSATNTLPFTQPKWFYYLNAPDSGMRNITNIALSAASTGNVDWIIGKTIGIVPTGPILNHPMTVQGVNSNLLLDRAFDAACLALMQYFSKASSSPEPKGMIIISTG